MGLTGIIYASIVVAWAAYLIPLALRRHEETARARSVDRFSTRMNVLSRRGRASSGRTVVTPPRMCDRMLSPAPSPAGSAAAVLSGPRPSRVALETAARRRRRVLLVLASLLAAVAAAAVMSFLPLWSIAAPVASLAAFLMLARRQARRASDAYWEEAQAPFQDPTNVIRRGSTRVDASHGAARGPDDEPTVPLDRDKLRAAVAALEQEHSVAVSLPTSDGTSLWDPLPIVLPTYVEKATASSTIRTVDLSATSTPTVGGAEGSTVPAGRSSDSEIWVRQTASTSVSEPTDDVVNAEPAKVVNG